MLTLTQDWLDAERAARYRRTPARRVHTLDEAQQFIDEVGFAFLWPIKGIEAPNLFEAIAGRVREVPNVHDDPDLGRCWSWKDQSLGGSRWYYAKLLRRKATLVAPRLQGVFYALTHNYGDLEDYMERVVDGLMTHEARLIYEALLDHGPMNTIDLRSLAGQTTSISKARFERGLVELQIDMKVLPVAVVEAGGWRYSFLYDIAMRHYPDLPALARQISTAEAWQTLIGTYLDAVITATGKHIGQVFHVFEPTKRDLEKALDSLQDAGHIQPAAIKDGAAGWVSTRTLTPAD